MPLLGAASSTSSSSRVLNAVDYGADPTGTTDSWAAITAALNALPKFGGTVLLPATDAGAVYLLSQELVFGDGTTTSVSTKHGMRLVGEGVTAFPVMAGGAMNSAPVTLRRTGTSGTNVVRVAGPLSGWGMDDLTLDAGSVASTTGLRVVAGQYGAVRGLSVLNALTGVLLTSIPNFGGIICNAMHNDFQRLSVLMANVDQAVGIAHTGAGGVTSNTCYNRLQGVSIVPGGQSLAGSIFGIKFGACDTESYDGVHMVGNFSTAATNPYGVVFDYGNGQNTGWPFDCQIQNIDFGRTDGKAVINNGTLSGGATNRIAGIVKNNGFPANPALPGLVWGYSVAT